MGNQECRESKKFKVEEDEKIHKIRNEMTKNNLIIIYIINEKQDVFCLFQYIFVYFISAITNTCYL